MGKRTSRPVDLPTAEQLATERRRLRYKSKYSRTLRSTVAILVVVAALAVLDRYALDAGAAHLRQFHVTDAAGWPNRCQHQKFTL